jgi:D-3-phosphoglycerate dehydrogenase
VLVTIQTEAVIRPVAVGALTFILALSQHLVVKDRLTRTGGWNRRQDHMGTGLIGRTLGVIGAGRIGQELLRLAAPFGLRLLAADPHVPAHALAPLGATLVPLDTLLAESDFVVVLVPLAPQTRHLIGAPELTRMKPTARLINIARGPIVDEAALIAALQAGTIAGAGLDVFDAEPILPDNPLLAMEQVIVTPHALSWTDQCFEGIAASGMRGIIAVRDGLVPGNALNPEAMRG